MRAGLGLRALAELLLPGGKKGLGAGLFGLQTLCAGLPALMLLA
jgi:hypothetical protein